jgi:hypothetical protein
MYVRTVSLAPVIDEPSLLVGEVRVCLTGAICWLLPIARRRGGSLGHRRLGVLGRRLVVIINRDALPSQLLDLLPRCCTRQTTHNVGGHIVRGLPLPFTL